jgi:hypothetical protein
VSGPSARTLTPSERDWLTVRSYLTEHRYDLGVDVAEDYRPLAGWPEPRCWPRPAGGRPSRFRCKTSAWS